MSFYSDSKAASVVTLTKGVSGAPDIRKFDQSELNDAITAAMKSIPADKHVIALARVDMTGARLTIAGRVPSDKIPGELDWTVYVDKPWEGTFDAGLGVRWSI